MPGSPVISQVVSEPLAALQGQVKKTMMCVVGDYSEQQDIMGDEEDMEIENIGSGEQRNADDTGHGSIRPKVCKSTIARSTQEQAKHNVTHGTFRSWCTHCLICKARAQAHRTRQWSEEQRVPGIDVDGACVNNKTRQHACATEREGGASCPT